MKNSLSSYVRNTAFRPAGLSRGSSSSEAFWNTPFSLSNSSIFSPVNCWNTRGFVLASSYFIFFPPLPSFYSLLHAFPIDSFLDTDGKFWRGSVFHSLQRLGSRGSQVLILR